MPPKGVIKVLPKIAVAVPPKGALKVLPKIAIGNFSGGRRTGGEHSRCCPGNVRECNQWFFKIALVRIVLH